MSGRKHKLRPRSPAYKKSKNLAENEVRVLKLPRAAIEEILWEYFMENGSHIMGMNENNPAEIFSMSLNDAASELILKASRIDNIKKAEAVDCDGFTASSVFDSEQKPAYITVTTD